MSQVKPIQKLFLMSWIAAQRKWKHESSDKVVDSSNIMWTILLLPSLFSTMVGLILNGEQLSSFFQRSFL